LKDSRIEKKKFQKIPKNSKKFQKTPKTPIFIKIEFFEA